MAPRGGTSRYMQWQSSDPRSDHFDILMPQLVKHNLDLIERHVGQSYSGLTAAVQGMVITRRAHHAKEVNQLAKMLRTADLANNLWRHFTRHGTKAWQDKVEVLIHTIFDDSPTITSSTGIQQELRSQEPLSQRLGIIEAPADTHLADLRALEERVVRLEKSLFNAGFFASEHTTAQKTIQHDVIDDPTPSPSSTPLFQDTSQADLLQGIIAESHEMLRDELRSGLRSLANDRHSFTDQVSERSQAEARSDLDTTSEAATLCPSTIAQLHADSRTNLYHAIASEFAHHRDELRMDLQSVGKTIVATTKAGAKSDLDMTNKELTTSQPPLPT